MCSLCNESNTKTLAMLKWDWWAGYEAVFLVCEPVYAVWIYVQLCLSVRGKQRTKWQWNTGWQNEREALFVLSMMATDRPVSSWFSSASSGVSASPVAHEYQKNRSVLLHACGYHEYGYDDQPSDEIHFRAFFMAWVFIMTQWEMLTCQRQTSHLSQLIWSRMLSCSAVAHKRTWLFTPIKGWSLCMPHLQPVKPKTFPNTHYHLNHVTGQ